MKNCILHVFHWLSESLFIVSKLIVIKVISYVSVFATITAHAPIRTQLHI